VGSRSRTLRIGKVEHGWDLLRACDAAGLVLVTFDRRTIALHAARLTQHGEGHSGVIVFRGLVRRLDYGYQARLLTEFWQERARTWDWKNLVLYLPAT